MAIITKSEKDNISIQVFGETGDILVECLAVIEKVANNFSESEDVINFFEACVKYVVECAKVKPEKRLTIADMRLLIQSDFESTKKDIETILSEGDISDTQQAAAYIMLGLSAFKSEFE